MSGLVVPISPAQRRVRDQLNAAFDAILKQQSSTARLLAARDHERRAALASGWERGAEAMIGVGFAYGYQVQAMAERLRGGSL